MKTVNYVIAKDELDAIEDEFGPLGYREYLNGEIPMKISNNNFEYEVDEVIDSENGFYIIKYNIYE